MDQVRDFELEKKDLIFIPVNDCQDISQGGGSHWSLLVYNRKKDRYIYLDSAGKYNLKIAVEILKKLSKIITPNATEVDLEEVKAPNQNNSYDCGVFLCCFTENLAENEGDIKNLSQTKEQVKTMRKKIYDLITSEDNFTSPKTKTNVTTDFKNKPL